MEKVVHQRVEVVDYDPAWPAAFEKKRQELIALVGEVIVAVSHIGSTAVPGLAAKPVIDILLEVTGLDELDSLAQRFSDNGYQVWGENQIPGRRYFTKGTMPRTHNIHGFQTGHTGLARHIAFRDYLISNPEIAAEYGQLKRKLAARCKNDIELYCAGKDPFIKEHERIALTRYLP